MIKKNRGLSIVEVLIAIGILGIIVAGVTYMVSSQKATTVRVGNLAGCEAVRDAILTDFKNEDNRLRILNEVTAPFDFEGRSERDLEESGVFYNFQNIESATTRAYQISRRHMSAVCGDGLDLKNNLNLLKSVEGLDDSRILSAMLKLTPYDVTKSQTLSCDASGIEQVNVPNRVLGDKAVGFRVHVSVNFQLPDGAKSCDGEVVVSFQADRNAPQVQARGLAGDAGNDNVWETYLNHPLPRMPQNTLCDTTKVRLEIESSEPGSLFLCGRNTTISSYVNCEGYELISGNVATRGVLTKIPGLTDNQPTRAYLTFSSVPEGQYTVFTQSVDTAGNRSLVALDAIASTLAGVPPGVVGFFFTVDQNRPVWQAALESIAPTAGGAKTVDTAASFPSGSLFLPATSAIATTFGARMYQCNGAREPRYRGRIQTPIFLNEDCSGVTTSVATAANARTIPASQSTISGDAGSGYYCTLNVPASPSFEPGDVRLTASIRDLCSAPSPGGDVNASADWIVDPPLSLGGTGLTATHAPNGSSPSGPLVQASNGTWFDWDLNFSGRTPNILNSNPVAWGLCRTNGKETPIEQWELTISDFCRARLAV